MTEEDVHTAIDIRLEIEPVDTLFFRDARPFEASSRAASGLPLPQTLFGAIRTVLMERAGVDFDRWGKLLRAGASFTEACHDFGPAAAGIARVAMSGPWFSQNDQPLVAMPANLRLEKSGGKPIRLDPLDSELPGWSPPLDGMRPLWRRGRSDLERIDSYLSLEGLQLFLDGEAPEPKHLVPAAELYGFEDRVGIGIDGTSNVSSDGMIYAVRMLTLCPMVRLSAELSGPPDSLTPLLDEPFLIRLGGEGRQAYVRASVGSLPWPTASRRPVGGKLILLTGPAWFDGWYPKSIQPLAAAVPGYRAVSGWDLAARGPKPNRFMVEAGSVYFLPQDAKDHPSQLVPDDDAIGGWGSFLEGNWNYA